MAIGTKATSWWRGRGRTPSGSAPPCSMERAPSGCDARPRSALRAPEFIGPGIEPEADAIGRDDHRLGQGWHEAVPIEGGHLHPPDVLGGGRRHRRLICAAEPGDNALPSVSLRG